MSANAVKQNREALIQRLNIARPSLSSQAFVPVLSHFCFDGVSVMAYNDVQAIVVRSPLGVEFCVPGDLFLKVLNSLKDEEVGLTKVDSALQVLGKKSTVTLPLLPVSDFTFDPPLGSLPTDEWSITDDFLRGLTCCLISAGVDPSHPAQMGVTVIHEGDRLSMFSTDNFTISRYQTASTAKISRNPVILPTAFCEQLITMAKSFPDESITLQFFSGAVIAKFGEMAWLFSKLILDVAPLAFSDIIAQHIGDDVGLSEIPPEFDGSLSRALLILSSEHDKQMSMLVSDATLTVGATSSIGRVMDIMGFDSQMEEGSDLSFWVDPEFVQRALKVCTHMSCLPNVCVMGDGPDLKFTHLIAHCATRPSK